MVFAAAWIADARFPWIKSRGCWRLDYLKLLDFCPTTHVYLDAISTIMAIVLLNLNAKYLFVTFRIAFEFSYFY